MGLCFCARAFSSCRKRGPLFIAVRGPLTVVASPLRSTGSRRAGSAVVAHGLSCPAACGIFPDQGSNTVSPALAGRFLTTAPPGKPELDAFKQTDRHKINSDFSDSHDEISQSISQLKSSCSTNLIIPVFKGSKRVHCWWSSEFSLTQH